MSQVSLFLERVAQNTGIYNVGVSHLKILALIYSYRHSYEDACAPSRGRAL